MSSSSSQTPEQTTTNPSATSSSETPTQTTTSSSSAIPSSQTLKQTTTTTTTTSSSSRSTSSSVHGPSDLPPVSYGKPNSPWAPKQPRQHSKDIESAKLGTLMNRMDRIEKAVGKYVDERGKEALKKSVVPGLETKEDSDDEAEA